MLYDSYTARRPAVIEYPCADANPYLQGLLSADAPVVVLFFLLFPILLVYLRHMAVQADGSLATSNITKYMDPTIFFARMPTLTSRLEGLTHVCWARTPVLGEKILGAKAMTKAISREASVCGLSSNIDAGVWCVKVFLLALSGSHRRSAAMLLYN